MDTSLFSGWFSPHSLVSSTDKTDCHYITEILLKVALSTITLTLVQWESIFVWWKQHHWLVFFLRHLQHFQGLYLVLAYWPKVSCEVYIVITLHLMPSVNFYFSIFFSQTTKTGAFYFFVCGAFIFQPILIFFSFTLI